LSGSVQYGSILFSEKVIFSREGEYFLGFLSNAGNSVHPSKYYEVLKLNILCIIMHILGHV